MKRWQVTVDVELLIDETELEEDETIEDHVERLSLNGDVADWYYTIRELK